MKLEGGRRWHASSFSIILLASSTTISGTKINDEIYIHLQYHPDDISLRELSSIYDEHLDAHFKSTLDIKRAIVAYSRPKNIGDYATRAKLNQAPGKEASVLMGGIKRD